MKFEKKKKYINRYILFSITVFNKIYITYSILTLLTIFFDCFFNFFDIYINNDKNIVNNGNNIIRYSKFKIFIILFIYFKEKFI